MNANNSVEITAASIDEAVREGLRRLGAAEDDVIIEIISRPRAGVLGLGARSACVRVSRRPPQGAHSTVQSPPAQFAAAAHRVDPGDAKAGPVQAGAATASNEPLDAAGADRRRSSLEEQGREAAAILTEVLSRMGEQAEIVLVAADPEGIEIEVKGDGSGILIGRHGQTLDALEYIVNRILARRVKEPAPIVLDSEAYRVRRRKNLERMALAMGERAKRDHETVKLDPMPPRDRRIVHLTLKDDPLVRTNSSGTGYLRAVEISPADRGHERPANERPHDRLRNPESVGQQGGFKHGQKKIV